jgi:hypothetical protein
MATPSEISVNAVMQDTNGYKSLVVVRFPWLDLSINNGPTDVLFSLYGPAQTYFSALQALSNAKIVEESYVMTFNKAQRPTNSPALYPNVNQRALGRFGNSTGLTAHVSVPAPVAGMFVSSPPDAGLVINPTGTNVPAWIAAVEALTAVTTGTALLNEFNGGQLVGGKPRRRRVVLGS